MTLSLQSIYTRSTLDTVCYHSLLFDTNWTLPALRQRAHAQRTCTASARGCGSARTPRAADRRRPASRSNSRPASVRGIGGIAQWPIASPFSTHTPYSARSTSRRPIVGRTYLSSVARPPPHAGGHAFKEQFEAAIRTNEALTLALTRNVSNDSANLDEGEASEMPPFPSVQSPAPDTSPPRRGAEEESVDETQADAADGIVDEGGEDSEGWASWLIGKVVGR